ncbi:hypothetical protein BDQ17DRAFT_653512 [Cyathus striatus]|nr:hypothetical protein BDQ17DRAFT_653512 [Cyathus striatus]
MEKLSPEVISLIFDVACDDYREYVRASMNYLGEDDSVPQKNVDLLYKKAPPITPLNLGYICRRWKAIANSTPILWDTVWLKSSCNDPVTEKSSLETYMNNAEIFKTWIERAGCLPLTIKVEEFFSGCNEYGDGSIWEQVITHSK